MRILFASSSSGSRGGGELYLLYLGEALAQRGHEVVLWASKHPRMDELCESFSRFGKVIRAAYRNTYDHPFRSLGHWLDFFSSSQIAKDWQSVSPDLVHINKQNLEDGLDLLQAAHRASLPTVCTIHLTQTARYLGAQLAPTRDFTAKRALKKFPGPFVAVLENRRKNLSNFLGTEAEIRTIPNGVPVFDLAELARLRPIKRAELSVPDGSLLVTAVGRMVPQKRPLLFLEKARQILEHLPDTKFLWVGDGWLSNEWDQYVAQHHLGEAVIRVPWQSSVIPFLAAADLFLHVADYEGLPLALLEAMSAGLPCAVADNLLAEMPFLNVENSIAVGTDSEEWLRPLRDRALLRRLGQASRQLLMDEFSFAKMASQYEALYGSVL